MSVHSSSFVVWLHTTLEHKLEMILEFTKYLKMRFRWSSVEHFYSNNLQICALLEGLWPGLPCCLCVLQAWIGEAGVCLCVYMYVSIYRWIWIWRTTVRQIFAYDRLYASSQSDAYQVFVICIRWILHITDQFSWSHWVRHIQVHLYMCLWVWVCMCVIKHVCMCVHVVSWFTKWKLARNHVLLSGLAIVLFTLLKAWQCSCISFSLHYTLLQVMGIWAAILCVIGIEWTWYWVSRYSTHQCATDPLASVAMETANTCAPTNRGW